MDKKIKIIEIRRVSTKKQAVENKRNKGVLQNDVKSELPRQRELNDIILKRYNLERFGEPITIVDVSGTSVLKSPEIQKVLRLIQSSDIEGIVVSEFDRLIRPDNYDDYSLLQRLKESNTKLYTQEKVYDFNTQDGFLSGGIRATISGDEISRIKHRLMSGKEHKRKEGKCPDNLITLPTGVTYDPVKEKFSYTSESLKVRKCFEILINGGTYKDCERKTGLQARTVSCLVRNKIWIGYRVYAWKRGTEKYVQKDGRHSDKKKVRRDPGEVIEVKVINEPLIDEDMFYRTQKIVNRIREEFHTRRRVIPEGLWLHGYLYCECGQPKYSYSVLRNGKRRDEYYFCKSRKKCYSHLIEPCKNTNWEKASDISKTVCSFISEKLSNKGFFVDLVEKYAESKSDKTKTDCDLKILSEKVAELENKRKKLLDLYADGIYSKEELNEKVEKFNEEIFVNKELMCDLRKEKEILTTAITIEDIRSIIQTFNEFKYLDYNDKRNVLSKFMPKIYTKNGGITSVSLARQSESVSRWQYYNFTQQFTQGHSFAA